MDPEITTKIFRADRVKVDPILVLEPLDDCTVVGLCDVGIVREENQDFMGHFHHNGGHLLVVADGMGGHNGGWEASHLVVEACEQALQEWDDKRSPIYLLSDCVQLANTKLIELSAFEPHLQGMGSTFVAIYVREGKAWSANVGDSRSYLIRKGEIRRISRDHSRVGMMVEAGLLSEEIARKHPMANVLDMALGVEDFVAPEMSTKPMDLEEGDRFLLCSDGLWGLVLDSELLELFARGNAEIRAQKALEMALERGGKDNVTIALLDYKRDEAADEEDLEAPKRNTANLMVWEMALVAIILACVGIAWAALRLQQSY
jgi:protein phosphatase